jgi:hypothetical protein
MSRAFDRKLVRWEAGQMKTTIDLPEDLVREMKLCAAQEGRKLKDIAAEAMRRGLRMPEPATTRGRRRVKLPIIAAPRGASSFDLTGERVHELEMQTEAESHEASLRR